MAKAQIIKEHGVERIKTAFLDIIQNLNAELVVLDCEAKQEREHNRKEATIRDISEKTRICQAKRDIYHICLCEVQRNISEVEI